MIGLLFFILGVTFLLAPVFIKGLIIVYALLPVLFSAYRLPVINIVVRLLLAFTSWLGLELERRRGQPGL